MMLSRSVLGVLLTLSSAVASAAPSIVVGFSPEGSALQVVVQTLAEARQSIRMMGYSFTSPEVVKRLLEAKDRGVDVQVVLDDNGNHSKSSVAAINLLVNHNIPVRMNSRYKIQHDKVIITDGRNVETGSFNFTASAAHANSENALLLRDVPEIASQYLAHWQSRWEQGEPATATY